MSDAPLGFVLKYYAKKFTSLHSTRRLVDPSYEKREGAIRVKATADFKRNYPEFRVSGYLDGWDCYLQWMEDDIKHCALFEFQSDALAHAASLEDRSSVKAIIFTKLRGDEAPEIRDRLPNVLKTQDYINRWPAAQNAVLGAIWLQEQRDQDEAWARQALGGIFQGQLHDGVDLREKWRSLPSVYKFNLISEEFLAFCQEDIPIPGWRAYHRDQRDEGAFDEGLINKVNEQFHVLLQIAQHRFNKRLVYETYDFEY